VAEELTVEFHLLGCEAPTDTRFLFAGHLPITDTRTDLIQTVKHAT